MEGGDIGQEMFKYILQEIASDQRLINSLDHDDQMMRMAPEHIL